MEKNVAMTAVIGQDESIALGHVEPFDSAGNLDQIGGVTLVTPDGSDRVLPHRRGLIPHQSALFLVNTPQTDS